MNFFHVQIILGNIVVTKQIHFELHFHHGLHILLRIHYILINTRQIYVGYYLSIFNDFRINDFVPSKFIAIYGIRVIYTVRGICYENTYF